MSARGDLHTRAVFWLKILLPLAALAVLSTLFMFSRNLAPTGLLPFSKVDVEELARDQRLTAPEYAGMTNDGAAVSVSARVARPATADTGATAEGLVADFVRKPGETARILADSGLLDQPASLLTLTGNVVMTTSDGYRVESGKLTARLDRTEILSPQKVSVEAPYGHIEAGEMSLTAPDAKASGNLLVFKGGVRLVYEPSKRARK